MLGAATASRLTSTSIKNTVEKSKKKTAEKSKNTVEKSSEM